MMAEQSRRAMRDETGRGFESPEWLTSRITFRLFYFHKPLGVVCDYVEKHKTNISLRSAKSATMQYRSSVRLFLRKEQ